jgi:hypothetical protein
MICLPFSRKEEYLFKKIINRKKISNRFYAGVQCRLYLVILTDFAYAAIFFDLFLWDFAKSKRSLFALKGLFIVFSQSNLYEKFKAFFQRFKSVPAFMDKS